MMETDIQTICEVKTQPKEIANFLKVSLKEWLASGEDEKDYDDIILPFRKTEDSAGYDIFYNSSKDILLAPGESVIINTGIRSFIESPWFLSIFPRSGLGFKYHLSLANTAGIIDGDYFYSDNEGHIKVKIVNRGNKCFELKKGTPFCQGIFMQYGITYNDDDTLKLTRNGGFGSTDEKRI